MRCVYVYTSSEVGVVGGCAKICTALEEKVNIELVGTLCDIVCDIEGVEEFVKIVQK